jgi:DNA replication and repair protein RecF
VVLVGPNGAGKTNLLESLSFLVPGRGLRRARLSEVARQVAGAASGGWAVAARLARPEGSIDIGTGCEPADGAAERRQVRIDGGDARSQAALAEVASAVWLTPHMDRLFADGASGRRRFLDRMVFGLDPAHAGRVSAYEHAMRERSRLLREGEADRTWLATLEGTMAERGIAIAAARRDMAARLDDACASADGPFPAASLAMRGDVEDWLDQGPALAAEDRLRDGLARSRPLDTMTGGAAVGPHRSDLVIRHRDKDMPAEQCSTGEQKAVLIAIVLADARLQARERGSVPLMLLDEVVAHLDEMRRTALFDAICDLGAQAWMTGTDEALFEPLATRAQRFRVENATLSPI